MSGIGTGGGLAGNVDRTDGRTPRFPRGAGAALSIAQAPGLVRLSTQGLERGDRFAIWREVYGRHMLNLDIEAIGDAPFRADVSLRALPGVNVMFSARSPTRTSTTRSLLPTSSDTLVLAVTAKGRAQARQLGRDEAVPLGGAVLMTTAELASHTLLDEGCLLSIAAPRAAIAPYVRDIGSVLMRPFSADSEILRLLVDYARGALALGESAPPALQDAVAVHLRDLMAMLLGAHGDDRELFAGRGVRAARLRAVKDEVLIHLGRADLSAETVAQRLRITANYVRKLLLAEGVSFSDYVLALRLERVSAALQDPRQSGRAISSIALDTGFNDISYFNRSFRRRFGRTPSEVRAGA